MKKKIRVTEEDIHCYKIAKSEKAYANIINDNMITSALRGAGLFDGWDILVLRDRLLIQRYENDDMRYLYGHPVYFCTTLVDYLRIHDAEDFLKLDEFDMDLIITETDSASLALWPYEVLAKGTLTINV